MNSKTKFEIKHPELAQAIHAYTDFINESWRTTSAMGSVEDLGIYLQPGRKFVKIMTTHAVHSFIVISDFNTGKSDGFRSFKAGDILMAATLYQPALNKARGNVLELNYGKSSWTGTGYL